MCHRPMSGPEPESCNAQTPISKTSEMCDADIPEGVGRTMLFLPRHKKVHHSRLELKKFRNT